jgi:hypothetical protein
MIPSVHPEVLFALAYALFLLGVAALLEYLARRSQQRAEGYRNSGFVYFRELDYWECPAGHQLVQLSSDHERQVTLYRAQASACNSCSLKRNCTDSNEGRLLERRLNTWVDSEVRRFHRGISGALHVLATTLLLAEMIRYPHPHDREALAFVLLPLCFLQIKLLPSLAPWRKA